MLIERLLGTQETALGHFQRTAFYISNRTIEQAPCRSLLGLFNNQGLFPTSDRLHRHNVLIIDKYHHKVFRIHHLN